MNHKPIFSETFLLQHLKDFQLADVVNIRIITALIRDYSEEIENGKIQSLKEEEIKSRFVSVFLGDVLGFNYGNSSKWLLREEKKSATDGTKPDAALGYFFIDKKKDDVRAVVEIKSASAGLDEKQAREGNLTPVDQAFTYVPKAAGGKCGWVIVSNMIEIRFYKSLDRSRYQSFLLKDLLNDFKLKEFLFLFHKDRLMAENLEVKSPTDRLYELAEKKIAMNDKPLHIIDKIYESLKRFESFGFVDPNYIATLYPFNVINDYVWHYSDYNLLTLNSEIGDFLQEIEISEFQLGISDKLKNEIREFNVVEAEFKIRWSFKFLNHCMIQEISAASDYRKSEQRRNNGNLLGFSARHRFTLGENEGITKNIRIFNSESCDCMVCNFRRFDFLKILKKLKAAEGSEDLNSFSFAYANYLMASNNFKTCYIIYKNIAGSYKGRQDKSAGYFLANLNIKLLYNLIDYYSHDDKNIIMDNIKSIDLDKVIYNEIEFDIDNDVRKYLLDVKDDKLVYRVQDRIAELLFSIEKLYNLYKDGGSQSSGPLLSKQLMTQYLYLYNHINCNGIIYDNFTRYKNLTEKVLKGMLLSSNTPRWGAAYLSRFLLVEAIIHVEPKSFQEIFKDEFSIKIQEGFAEVLLNNLRNFCHSMYIDGLFADTAHENELMASQLAYWSFADRVTNIFTNTFTLLSKMNLSKEEFSSSFKPLLNFLRTEKHLAGYDLKELANFIRIKGGILEVNNLQELLHLVIEKDRYGNNKYRELLSAIPESISNFYPDYRFSSIKLVRQAVLNNTRDDGSEVECYNLIWLSQICDATCRNFLFKEFKNFLNQRFDTRFFEKIVRIAGFSLFDQEYFKLYCETVNKQRHKSRRFGDESLTDVLFINFVLTLYNFKADFAMKEIKSVEPNNNFESWLLDPDHFDYAKFEASWLLSSDFEVILKRMKNIQDIGSAIKKELKRNYQSRLSEILFKHFNE